MTTAGFWNPTVSLSLLYITRIEAQLRHTLDSRRICNTPKTPPHHGLHDYSQRRNAITHYGNTQAVVLDTYRNGAGHLRNYNAPGIDSNGLPYKTWARERQRRLNTFTGMLERNDYTGSSPAGCESAVSALLGPYGQYNKLFDERKYAKNYPFVQSSANFMVLPMDIRTQIYRLHLQVDGPIELLTRSSSYWCSPAEAADKIAQIRLREIQTSRLGLLRVCRTINREASDVFYGETEFRFTGQNGWTWLRGFMHTIGPLNTSHLRLLTMHVPWDASRDYTDHVRNRKLPKTLRGPKRRYMYTLRDFANCVSILNHYGRLRRLNLVLPMSLSVIDVRNLDFDLSRVPDGWEIKLIHITKPTRYTDGKIEASQLDLPQPKPRRYKRGRRILWDHSHFVKLGDAQTYATSMGWKYEVSTIDEAGNY